MTTKTEDKEKLKELALELREVFKDNRKSSISSKFDTFFKYILNKDIKIGVRRRFLKTLIQYQYLMGKCKGSDAFSEKDGVYTKGVAEEK